MAHPSLAKADELSDAAECARIANGELRLACYDKLFREASSDGLMEPEPGSIEEFGAEQLKVPPIDFLEARLIDDFTGWSGNTRFRLDNGQVWQQTKNYIRDYKAPTPIPQAKVTISRGLMGTYNLRVEGVKRVVQVRRIK